VAELVEGLGALLPGAKPHLTLALREGEANLELKLEVAGYPRQAVEQLAQGVTRSGGRFVELWRLPKAERDAFRTTSFSGTTRTAQDYAEAARLLQQHLAELPAAAAPAAPQPRPAPAPEEAPPAPPSTEAPEAPEDAAPAATEPSGKRRAQRFAVKLEMEFRTELDFVREHALNISNGGLFVRTAHRPPIDSVVTVDVRLPNGERLQGDAVVVHVVDDPYAGGVGLAFLTEDPTFSETLDRYLASLVGAPE
jgi:uncharacterized protein (TIGR02266 family)